MGEGRRQLKENIEHTVGARDCLMEYVRCMLLVVVGGMGGSVLLLFADVDVDVNAIKSRAD